MKEREDEDEKIRQFLIHEVTETSDEIMSYRNMNKKAVLAWLEKQGKQNTVFEMKTPEESLGVDSDTYNKIVDECIYGEQKPADKAEPKFNVGDWIVFDNNVYYIGNIALKGYYECLRVDGTVHTFSLDIDSKSHLWTIQDAKDGKF